MSERRKIYVGSDHAGFALRQRLAGYLRERGHDVEAQLARAHNDANVLCLGARFTPEGEARKMIDAWLGASLEGGRHARSPSKVQAIERQEELP